MRPRTSYTLLAFAALSGVTGCATGMSESACASADWYAIGITDGTNGKTEAAGQSRGESCYDHGYIMETRLYEAGRQEGLKRYCTPENGYDVGLSGASYNGVCVRHDETVFLAEYEVGQIYKGYLDAVNGAASALEKAEARIERIDEKLDVFYRDLSFAEAADAPPKEIDHYHNRISDLTYEQDELIDSLVDLGVDLRLAERDLREFETELEVRRRTEAVIAEEALAGGSEKLQGESSEESTPES